MAQHFRIATNSNVSSLEDLPKLIVRRQLVRSGNTLLSALEPIRDDEFFAGGPSGISAAWTLGHLSCVADLFGSAMDDGVLAMSTDVHQVFNSLDIAESKTTTKADGVNPAQFPKARLIAMMRKTQVRLLKVLDAFDVQRWNDPAPDRLADTLPTFGAMWEHLAVHTYWHLGELSSAVERFHGTYSMNSMPHYFIWGENDTEAARRAEAAQERRPVVLSQARASVGVS